MVLREVVIVGAGCSGACTVREICAQLRRKIEAMDEEERPEENETSTSPYELLVTVVDKGGPRLQHKHDEVIYSSSSSSDDDDALNKLLNHLHTIKKEEDVGGEEEDETREKEKKPSFMSYENHLIQTFWKGVAYGAKDDHHLLNVPTAFMSAVHRAEGDFKNWLLEACSPDQALNSPATELFYPEIDSRWIKFSENGHCCRRIFGQYLTHRTNCEIIRLFQTLKKRNSITSMSNKKTRKDITFTLRLVAAEALNVKDGNGGSKEKSSLVIKKMTPTTTTQQRDDGHKDQDTTTVPFDDLVLAHGNLPPKVMKSLEPLVTNSSGVASSFIGNPWKFPAVDLISSTSSSSSSTLIPTAATTTPPPPFRIAIIGTRLTAIDFALHLYHQPNGLKDLSDIQKQKESGGMDKEMRKKVELVFLSREGLFPFPNPGEEQLPSVDSTCLLVPEAIPILEKEHKRRVLLKEQQEERETAVEEGEKMKEQQAVRLTYLLQEPADSFLDFELFFNEIQRVLASLSLETLLSRLEQCLRDPQQQGNQPPSSVVQWEQRLDSLRPWTSLLWMSSSGADRSTLLRKYRGVFEVRRHRVSPQIYSFMTSVLKLKLPASSSETQEPVGTTKYYHQVTDEDTSTFSAVSVRAEVIGSRFITPPDKTCAANSSSSSHHKIGIKLRSTSGQDGGEEREEIFDLVVNCTGPNADYRTTEHPLIASLRESHLIDPDENAIALRLQPHRSKSEDEKKVSSSNMSTATILPGLVATPKTVEESGAMHFSGGKCPIPPRIFAVGPPRRGSEWETIAVKEIRQQAYVIAGQIV